MPTGVIEGPIAPLPKGTYRGSLADTILTILTESFYEEGQEYVLRARENTVEVVQPGRNDPVYHLSAARNVESYTDQQSITELVTEVRIVGEQSATLVIADDPGGGSAPAAVRPPIDRLLVPDDPDVARFGRFRALVVDQENDNPADLEAKANAIFSERGAPQRTRSLVAPDIPLLRRGDLIRVTAGTMDEYAVVSGVQHDADTRKMQVTIDSSGTFKHRQKKVAKEKAATLTIADDPG